MNLTKAHAIVAQGRPLPVLSAMRRYGSSSPFVADLETEWAQFAEANAIVAGRVAPSTPAKKKAKKGGKDRE